MTFDATFWVAVSFIIFIGALVYFKIPQNINKLLSKMIVDIKTEIEESEKLRSEAKVLLDNSQAKLNSAKEESEKIVEQAKKESDNLIIEINDKFHKSSEIKKTLAENKILQMKEAAIKEIKDNSVRLTMESVKKIISTSIDKSKLDTLFQKNLEESKIAIKKIKS